VVNAHTGLTGLQGERNGQMSFADAGGPKKDHVAFLADKGQIEEGHHLLAIQLGLEGKIELVDALDKRKPRYL